MIGRRALLGSATVAMTGGGLTLAGAATSDVGSSAGTTRPETIASGNGIAEAETIHGRVAGYRHGEIFVFKGIPYGDTTVAGNRFTPPQKPKSWSGVRSSRSYGMVAPQDKGTGRLNDEEAFIFQWNDSVEGEDCLRVNVWTPGLADRRRRPVMVWLHGGGFAAGSGNDLPAFDGRNLAGRGDVVVVTLNHRLNLLGFLDLSAYGERYRNSANVGMLDIVAALEWVRDNIAAFGGDPGCVTIFGQSGGGAKVSTLMGMPAARGLFHRAIVQSGSFSSSKSVVQSQRLGELMLRELDVSPRTIERLHTLPYLALRQASDTVLRRENGPPGPPDPRRMGPTLGFAPVTDGNVLPATPFGPDAPAMTADVPMMIGTTLNEFASGFNHPEYESMIEQEVIDRVEQAYPGRSGAIVSAFRKRAPGAKPFDIWSRISSAPVRRRAIAQAAAKSALKRAPAYLYWFTWQTPVLDGRPRAFHCAEIPFVFANAETCAHMTGGGARAAMLEARIADAWIAFARTGNPNHSRLAHWAPYSAEMPATMILDDQCRLSIGGDAEEQASIA